MNAKGKQKRAYCWYATPWEILRQLPGVASHLKAEVTVAILDQQAQVKTDTQAAEEMQEAKRKLFGRIQRSRSGPEVGLPLVGRAAAPTFQPSKTKTSLEGKPTPNGVAHRLPLVGPVAHQIKQERRP